jgi:hypothetical protein
MSHQGTAIEVFTTQVIKQRAPLGKIALEPPDPQASPLRYDTGRETTSAFNSFVG